MEPVVHFLFPFIVALGARMHIKHGLRWILLLSLAAVALDIDHYILLSRGVFHNVFVVILLPAILIILAFKYEPRAQIKWKSLSVMSLLFLFSHPLLDMFTETPGVAWLYPLSEKFYSFANYSGIETTILGGKTLNVIGPGSISIVIFFAMMLLVYYLEEVIELMHKHHESLKRALKEAFGKEEREIEKEL